MFFSTVLSAVLLAAAKTFFVWVIKVFNTYWSIFKGICKLFSLSVRILTILLIFYSRFFPLFIDFDSPSFLEGSLFLFYWVNRSLLCPACLAFFSFMDSVTWKKRKLNLYKHGLIMDILITFSLNLTFFFTHIIPIFLFYFLVRQRSIKKVESENGWQVLRIRMIMTSVKLLVWYKGDFVNPATYDN